LQQDVDNGSNKQQILVNWLKLAQIPHFSVVSLAKLQHKHSLSLSELLASSTKELSLLKFNPRQIDAIVNPNQHRITSSLNWLQAAPNRFLLCYESPHYPKLLKYICSPPPLIYGYGNYQYLSRNQMAMVGTRNPSAQGKENAKYFAHQLSECGWTITSGLALGVDGLSHQGALIGEHITIAVLGTAIDKMYPKRHTQLADNILDHDGVIVSEFAPNTPSRPENFPRRNRIISGLSLGSLVVEAAIKSGSLITAKYALEQNREVFAIPGNIHNSMASGCHYLIQQGAKLVTCVEDINQEFKHLNLHHLPKIDTKTEKSTNQPLASDKLLDSVDFEVTPLDIVAQRSGISVEVVMSKLVEYELCGLVSAVPGGYIKLGEK
jgi:DNA processing protein